MNEIEIMKLRAEVLSNIRGFFSSQNYTEADVPLMTVSVIPEAPIELFSTNRITPYGDTEELFLLPSPEYYLKQLIAAGCGDIFSISRSFRNSEQTGRWHNPEFTMLEWYTMDADYMDSMATAESFFSYILEHATAAKPKAIFEPPFLKLSMTEIFDKYANFDISGHCTGELGPDEEKNALGNLAEKIGLKVSKDDSWEELFNLIFVHQIEPNLPKNRPTFIYDYPAGIPALAKPAAEKGRLERWELYIGGIELANCYTEETDPKRIELFFKNEDDAKKGALVPVKTDFNWCEMYKNDFPECSGTALGIDRLMMLLSGTDSIEGVILFPISDIIRQ